jgi:hypothetical protein
MGRPRATSIVAEPSGLPDACVVVPFGYRKAILDIDSPFDIVASQMIFS